MHVVIRCLERNQTIKGMCRYGLHFVSAELSQANTSEGRFGFGLELEIYIWALILLLKTL